MEKKKKKKIGTIRYDMTTRQVGKASAKSARLLIVPLVSLLFFAAPVSESTLTDLTNYQASRSSACLPRLWLTPHVNLSSKRGRKIGEERGTEIRVRALLLLLGRWKKFHWWAASSGERRKEERADPINFARHDLTEGVRHLRLLG